MTMKNARNCSEDGKSYFSLSTNDSTIVNGYNFKLNDGESAFSLSTNDFSKCAHTYSLVCSTKLCHVPSVRLESQEWH